MTEHGSPRRLAPGVVSLEDISTSAPGLRFDVRFPGASEDADRAAVRQDADVSHPLDGTGKLFLAVAVSRLAERDPGLLTRPLAIRGDHRTASRSGTLRRMSGGLQLSVDDATALVVGTGDAACVVALLELLEERGVNLLAEADLVAADLGLEATAFTGLEASAGDRSGEPNGVRTGECWGEGLVGTTSPFDLCTLLLQLVEASIPQPEASARSSNGSPAGDTDPSMSAARSLSAAVASRVLGWMGKTFEPAGLASALPGFGPRTIPHRTASGLELLGPPGAPGCASVLILPADVGTGRPTTCAAAYYQRIRADDSTASPREVSAILGSLGLAAARATTGPQAWTGPQA